MSEEDILKECNQLFVTMVNCHINGKPMADLLALYEQEKEKNNELEIELSTRDNINVDKLVEKYKYYRRLADSYQANCISKDKIKELLENETIDISGFRCIAVEDIEELLEEV